MYTIPKLDLSDFTSGDNLKKAEFVKQLGDAYEQIGFVAIRNHGIPTETLKQLYSDVEGFFSS